MKHLFTISVLVLLFPISADGQTCSFQPGEKVSYIVHYGLINGGIADLELVRDTLYGREVWHSKIMGKTIGLADALFKVLDIFESYIDPQTELPLKSIRNVHEGRYRRYNEVLFDHTTRSDSSILTSDLTGVHIAPPGIHDILSCFYWMRNHVLPNIENYKKGDIITIVTWFTDELYPLHMKYLGPEEVRTRSGKIRCYKFNPVTEVGRLFKSQDDVSFWFSADKNYLPVKIRFDIFVGGFVCDIINYEGLLYPLELKKKENN